MGPEERMQLYPISWPGDCHMLFLTLHFPDIHLTDRKLKVKISKLPKATIVPSAWIWDSLVSNSNLLRVVRWKKRTSLWHFNSCLEEGISAGVVDATIAAACPLFHLTTLCSAWHSIIKTLCSYSISSVLNPNHETHLPCLPFSSRLLHFPLSSQILRQVGLIQTWELVEVQSCRHLPFQVDLHS